MPPAQQRSCRQRAPAGWRARGRCGRTDTGELSGVRSPATQASTVTGSRRRLSAPFQPRASAAPVTARTTTMMTIKPFRVSLSVRLSPSNASTTINRVSHLLSADTTNHGACDAAIAEVARVRPVGSVSVRKSAERMFFSCPKTVDTGDLVFCD